MEDSNCGFAKVTVAKRDQEVVLHVDHNLKPGIEVLLPELLLNGSVKDLNMSLLKMIKFLLNNSVLQLL